MKSRTAAWVTVVVVCLAIGIRTASAAWFYDPTGTNRYDPVTGVAEYQDFLGVWQNDANFSTNPAYMLYIAGGGSSSVCSGTAAAAYSYNQGVGVGFQVNQDALDAGSQDVLAALVLSILSPEKFGSEGPTTYQDSALPEWDWDFALGASYADSDFMVDDTVGTRFDSRGQAWRLSANGSRDRLWVATSARYERMKGTDLFSGIDSETMGVRVTPGYRVLTQESDGVQMSLYTSLDLAYVDTDDVQSRHRVTPGLGFSLGRVFEFGYLLGAYTFTHNRNISGDTEVTGGHYFNMHSASFRYGLPLSENMIATAGLDYGHVEDTPGEVEHAFTTGSLGLQVAELGPWSLSLEYFEAIDGRDTRGAQLTAGFRW